VILRLERRRLVWINVTAHPTAEWIARQITEAFPWDEGLLYLSRDRDTAYGIADTPAASHGYPRSADLATLAVAERSC
jgi:hypothetical protein